MPPQRPNNLSAFLGRITRNLSLDMIRNRNSLRREGARTTAALDELSESVPSPELTGSSIELEELTAVINKFIGELKPEARKVFLRRYWYLCTPAEIADAYGISIDKVYKILQNTRAKLKEYLRKEGLFCA